MNPIVKRSYGILCTRYNAKSGKLEFLFVQRRNSYNYIDFVLKTQSAKARIKDSTIMRLLNGMTSDEKLEIMSFDYSRLWYRIWLTGPGSNSTLNHLTNDELRNYHTLERNFRERYYNQDRGQKLIDMINKSRTIEKMWEIPKGRKSSAQEKDLSCAIREFEEETGVSAMDYRILNETPFEVDIIDGNFKYIQVYYLAVYSGTSDPILQHEQTAEISDMKWLDLDRIRIFCQTEKIIKLVQQANKIFRKKYKLQKLYCLNMN